MLCQFNHRTTESRAGAWRFRIHKEVAPETGLLLLLLLSSFSHDSQVSLSLSALRTRRGKGERELVKIARINQGAFFSTVVIANGVATRNFTTRCHAISCSCAQTLIASQSKIFPLFSCYTQRNVNQCILNRVRVRVRG